MCEPVVPPTEKGKQHRSVLMILGFVHLALSIMMCFIMVMQGIYELIDVAILFCALAQMNFCCLIIYIINITINFFIIFNQLGLAVQNGELTDQMKDASFSQNLSLTVMILLAIYYIVANVFCFYAYREFKGMLFDAGMGGNFGMAGYGQGGQRNNSENDPNWHDQAPSAGAAAQGQPAGRAGGSSAQAQASSGGSKGGFKSFQGKGVTIGGS